MLAKVIILEFYLLLVIGDTHLVLFENTPFFSSLKLASFTMLAPMNGVSHGRHFFFICTAKLTLFGCVTSKRFDSGYFTLSSEYK